MHPARRLWVLFACAVLRGAGCTEHRPPPAPAAIPPGIQGNTNFSGTVRSVDYFSRFQGTALLCHFDPNFVVVIDVDDVTPEREGLRAPSRVAFAIHSAARCFGAAGMPDAQKDAIGRRFLFAIDQRKDERGISWRGLHVIGTAERLPR